MKFPIPPIDEQVMIIQFLKLHTGRIDDLVGKAYSAIELIQERRTALISAAVTGKIDVKNSQASESFHGNNETHKEEAA